MYLLQSDVNMVNKKIIKVINETISDFDKDFDFLSNDQQSNDNEHTKMLSDDVFQKQFILDSLEDTSKIELSTTDINIKINEDNETLTVTYNNKVKYAFDRSLEPIEFGLLFDGNNVDYSMGDNYTKIDWLDVNVNISAISGDSIDFIAFNKAPDGIKSLFIRKYLEEAILHKTGSNI